MNGLLNKAVGKSGLGLLSCGKICFELITNGQQLINFGNDAKLLFVWGYWNAKLSQISC